MSVTTVPHYYKKLSVYNPHGNGVSLFVNDVNANGVRRTLQFLIPPNCWRFVPDTEDVWRQIRQFGLQPTANQNSGFQIDPLPPISTTSPTSTDKGKIWYEELFQVTQEIIDNGYFEVRPQASRHHWDSSLLLPIGGMAQIYEKDYRIVNLNGVSRVILKKEVSGGPYDGVWPMLALGDTLSFRYRADDYAAA